MRILSVVGIALLSFGRVVFAQELDPDPNRTFVTSLKWKNGSKGPAAEKFRSARGTLAVLYVEGVYAETTAPFVERNGKQIGLNLSDGFVIRLGTWKRLEDSDLIRIESRETLGLSGEAKLDGPVTVRTCRLERPSSIHIADTIVCDGLIVDHARKPIDLGGFPSRVRQMVAAQNGAGVVSAR